MVKTDQKKGSQDTLSNRRGERLGEGPNTLARSITRGKVSDVDIVIPQDRQGIRLTVGAWLLEIHTSARQGGCRILHVQVRGKRKASDEVQLRLWDEVDGLPDDADLSDEISRRESYDVEWGRGLTKAEYEKIWAEDPGHPELPLDECTEGDITGAKEPKSPRS